jgi:tetratricopeptide (TPR) repeat protein
MTNTLPLQQLQLGEAFYQQGQYTKAAEIFEQLRFSSKNEALLLPRLSLNQALCAHKLWKEAKAEAHYQETIARAKKLFGEQHAIVATALDGLGKLYLEQGEAQRASEPLEEAHAIRQNAFGVEHPDTAESLLHLAELYTALSQYKAAKPFYEESIRILKSLVGEEDPRTAAACNCFGYFYWKTKNITQARIFLEEARLTQEKILPKEHPSRGSNLWNIALVARDQGDLNQATALLEEAFSLFEKSFGLQHPKSYCSLLDVGELYRLEGRSQDALALYNKVAQKSPIFQEARSLMALLQATAKTPKQCSWSQKQAKAHCFTQKVKKLSLADQRLVVTTAAGVYTYPLPAQRPQHFISTQLAQEAYLFPEDKAYLITPERTAHLWSITEDSASYQSYVGQLPQGPLVMLEERQLALCVEGQDLSLISLVDCQELAHITISSDGGEILAPVVSKNLVAVACLLGEKVSLYQLDTLEELDSFDTPEGVKALTFSALGTLYIATPSWVYAYQRGAEEQVTSWGWAIEETNLQLISASPDDALLAVSNSQETHLYSTKEHKKIATYPTGALDQLFFHPTHRLFFTVNQEEEACIWEY